ncbi:hypothetical protein KM918_09730 [Priestia megaterium]|uniref:hypothetical protein n=1 Tax=Priestia megaterium TaxID=1404 RepID=UPI001C216796|nr:hypothetical protein [Priestia megaterium]MBU8687615.1 hypothetical protein [Priestia megaterium]
MTCYTAINFRARLRFPRAAPELPRRFRFSRSSLRLALQSTAKSRYIYETYVHHHKKNPNEFDFLLRIKLIWIFN